MTLALMLLAVAAQCQGQSPTAPKDQRLQALALEQQGKNVEAEAAWRLYLQDHSSSPEPYAHLGLLEARQEHYTEAVALYRKALAINPANSSVHLNLGLALFKSGDMKQAIAEFQPLLAKQPTGTAENQRLTILVGMAYYGLAKYDEAIPYLKRAAAIDTQNLPLRMTLAHCYLWTKQYQYVLDTYHEILMLGAESAESDLLAGEALDAMKDNFGAIQQFRAAVKADPKFPGAHFSLGYLLWTQKQFTEAATEFQAELANDPEAAQAMAYLADIDLQRQQSEAALPLLEKAIRIDPSIEQAHLDLGVLYADAGRSEDALRELKVAESQAPEDVNIHWRLGRLYRTMGKTEEAKSEFEKASQINKKANDDLINRTGPGGKNPPPATPSVAPADEMK
jgi:tetratricopeptide (TPR) repeat protein